MQKTLFALALLLSGNVFADTVLVTAVQGKIVVDSVGSGKTPLEPFVRLKEGDRLSLPAGSQTKLVYVSRGRQETWQGESTVLVGDNESKLVMGKGQIQVRDIPPEVARLMNRTPGPAVDGRVGMMRMRSIPPFDAVVRLDREYAEMRTKTEASDILPEVFLLAGLFDLRQYERVENELKRVATAYPKDPTVPVLLQLYGKALAAARQPAEPNKPGQ